MKLAFLNKDGTLVISSKPNGFIDKPEQQVLKPGSLELVERLLLEDFTLVIVSNQGGIEKGFKSLEMAIDEMMYCNNLFVKELDRPVFERIYFCPDFGGNHCYLCEPDGYSKENQFWKTKPFDLSNSIAANKIKAKGRYRKPNSGMLEQAIEYYSGATLDEPPLEKIIMIGDRKEDKQAAENAKVHQFYWIDDAIKMVNTQPPQQLS